MFEFGIKEAELITEIIFSVKKSGEKVIKPMIDDLFKYSSQEYRDIIENKIRRRLV